MCVNVHASTEREGKTQERQKNRQNERREITGGRTDRRKGRKQLVHSHHVVTSRCSVTDGHFSWQKYWDKQFCTISAAESNSIIVMHHWFVRFSRTLLLWCEIITVLPLNNTREDKNTDKCCHFAACKVWIDFWTQFFLYAVNYQTQTTDYSRRRVRQKKPRQKNNAPFSASGFSLNICHLPVRTSKGTVLYQYMYLCFSPAWHCDFPMTLWLLWLSKCPVSNPPC